MNLSNIVTSLAMSKRLKEAGFRSESCFIWRRWDDRHTGFVKQQEYDVIHAKEAFIGDVPAFCFQQLSKRLPQMIHDEEGEELQPSLVWGGQGYKLIYDNYKYYTPHVSWTATTAADVAAQAVIWCIENNYILTNKHG
jgi:hypothetical protein